MVNPLCRMAMNSMDMNRMEAVAIEPATGRVSIHSVIGDATVGMTEASNVAIAISVQLEAVHRGKLFSRLQKDSGLHE